ncbi:zinc-ribbon domain-containing protein [Aquimarina algicola]|uniref:Zinc-ribbon domain-containing protein n=1 Tax=Aquimarina algicola TaxID=2589995 RepID=A0A504JD51_9FLAO|nr:zinc-ribbon domain-containing protein [Aquimarina algicola]TPN88946.1 zinc-ribbon domain-containing protein [Aquimarina algicola]
MFIFFGTRASLIKSKQIQGNFECSYCQNNTFNVSIYGRYFHVFWIPIFPLYKSTYLECTHCKKTYNLYETPENFREQLKKDNETAPPKRPLWHSFGGLVFLLIVTIIILSSTMNSF